MAIEGELARAGIVTLDTKTVFTRDVEFSDDVLINGSTYISEDAVFEGDLIVGGTISGTFSSIYVLEEEIDDLSAAAGTYVVVPSDGAGYISRVRTVLNGALGASDAVLSTNVNGGTDIGAGYDITIAYSGSAAGDIDDSGAIPSSEPHNAVAAAEYIRVYPSTTGGSAASCRVQIEITRTA
jgi:hypothetical protein